MQRTEKYFEQDAFRTECESVILAAEPDEKTGGGRCFLKIKACNCPRPPRPLRRSRARFPFLSPAVTSSPGAGEVFPQGDAFA